MPRKKGDGKGRLGGRAKGTPNKTTATAKERLADIVGDYYNSNKFKKDFKELEPLDRLKVMEKLTAYVVPKQQSVDASFDFDKMTAEQTDEIARRMWDGLNCNGNEDQS